MPGVFVKEHKRLGRTTLETLCYGIRSAASQDCLCRLRWLGAIRIQHQTAHTEHKSPYSAVTRSAQDAAIRVLPEHDQVQSCMKDEQPVGGYGYPRKLVAITNESDRVREIKNTNRYAHVQF
jgi:hypothetical protein